MRTVVALGGNAVVGQDDVSVARQRKRIRTATEPIRTLTDRGQDVVLTHGNGPQVGRSLERQAEASLPERPLAVLVAETQAQIGYLIAEELGSPDTNRVSTVLTRVRVEPDDPAFSNPSKPVGPYYDKATAAAKPFETMPVTTTEGEDAYRRAVPSPRPIEVLERDEIETLVDSGSTVVCGGGGGVPVVGDDQSEPDTAVTMSTDESTSTSVAAVVDKDHTTRLIASSVDADLLVMATDVEYAYRDFGTDDQRPIRKVDTATMRSALASGEFAIGSMRPKVEACLDFLTNGGDRVVITTPEQIVPAVEGDAGTQIVPAGKDDTCTQIRP